MSSGKPTPAETREAARKFAEEFVIWFDGAPVDGTKIVTPRNTLASQLAFRLADWLQEGWREL